MQKLKRRILPGLGALMLSASLLVGQTAGATGPKGALQSPEKQVQMELRGKIFSYVVLEIRVQNEAGSELTGAKVALQDPDNFTRTEETGTAWLLHLVPGRTYEIIVSKSGYGTQTFKYVYQLKPENGQYPKDIKVVTLVEVSGGNNGGNGGGNNSGGDSGDNGGGGSGGNGGGSGNNGGDSGNTGGNTGDNNGGAGGGSENNGGGSGDGDGSGGNGSGSDGNGSGGGNGSEGNGSGDGDGAGDNGANGGSGSGSGDGAGSDDDAENGSGNDSGNGSGNGNNANNGGNNANNGGNNANNGGNIANNGNNGGAGSQTDPESGSGDGGKNDYISGVATVTPPGEDGEDQVPVIEVTFPAGQTEFTIPRDTMADSAERGEDIRLTHPNGSGTSTTMQIPAFSDHDLDLVGESTLAVRWANTGWDLVIRVPQEDTERSVAGLCHNLISVALQDDMGLHVIYEDEPERSFYLTAEQVGEMAVDGVDLLFEYDRSRQAAGLAFEVQTAHHGAVDQAVLPAAAFEKAGEVGLELACRIYDPTGNEELWFEWLFAPEDLRGVEGRDVDLYLRATPDSDSVLFQLTRGIWSQYIVANQNAALPAKATLRVKNLEDFPAEEVMSLVCVDGRSLELIQDGLSPEGDWYSWETESCTSCALIENLDLIEVMGREYSLLRVNGTGTWDGRRIALFLFLPLMLILFFILLIIVLQQDEDEEEEDGGTAASDRNEEVVSDDG